MTAPSALEELSGRAYLRLVALGALIGIPAALVAAGFLALVHPAAVFAAAAAWLTHTTLDRRLGP